MADKRKGKPSAAQLRARAKFTRIMKSGGFKKKKKSSLKKSKPRNKKTVEKIKRRNRTRLKLGSASDIDKSLLLDRIDNINISRKNKMKVIQVVSKFIK